MGKKKVGCREEKWDAINFPSSLPFMLRTDRPPDSAKAASLSHLSHAKSRKRAGRYFTIIQVGGVHLYCACPPFTLLLLKGEPQNYNYITLWEIYTTSEIRTILEKKKASVTNGTGQ